MPARKNKWTVTCSKKNNSSIPNRNQDEDKNCQYKGVKGIQSTDSKHQMARETVFYDKNCQETNMQTVHSIPQTYSRFTRIKPVNQQDVARRSLTHTKDRRYRMASYQNQADTSLDATSTT